MTEADALTWIAEVFEEPPDAVTAGAPREAIAGWDSLGVLSLIAALDEKLDIAVSTDDIQSLKGVGDILNILRKSGKLS